MQIQRADLLRFCEAKVSYACEIFQWGCNNKQK